MYYYLGRLSASLYLKSDCITSKMYNDDETQTMAVNRLILFLTLGIEC